MSKKTKKANTKLAARVSALVKAKKEKKASKKDDIGIVGVGSGREITPAAVEAPVLDLPVVEQAAGVSAEVGLVTVPVADRVPVPAVPLVEATLGTDVLGLVAGGPVLDVILVPVVGGDPVRFVRRRVSVRRSGSGVRQGLSLKAAGERVLSESAVPMNCRAIVEAAAAAGYWVSPGGLTPEATLQTAIITEIKKNGDASRFVKVGRGLFTVKK